MKKILFSLLVLIIHLSSALAQEWITDFEKAKEIATTKERPIILVFQGSDWCAPCIRLDREIWSTEAFKNYAKSNFVMLQVDFPRKKANGLSESQVQANAQLAERYNKNGGFPLVVILDDKGNVLGKTSYKKTTPEGYIKELNSFLK